MTATAVLATSLAALGATFWASDVAPHHTVSLDHAGENYQVSYAPLVSVASRTVGAASGARQTTQRCVETAKVIVERAIMPASGRAALTARLAETRSFSHSTHGACGQARAHDDAGFARAHGAEIARFLARVAETDRPAALAAIDSARRLAAN